MKRIIALLFFCSLLVHSSFAQENTCATATPLTEGTFSGVLGLNGAPNYDSKTKYFSYTPTTDEKWLLKIQGTRQYNTYVNAYFPATFAIATGTCTNQVNVISGYDATRDSTFKEFTFKANVSHIISITSVDKYKFSATKSAANCSLLPNVGIATTTSTATASLSMPSTTIAWSYAVLPKNSVATPAYTLTIDSKFTFSALAPGTDYELYVLPYNCTTPFKFAFKTIGCVYPTGLKVDTVTSKYATISMDFTAADMYSDNWQYGFQKTPAVGSTTVAGTTTGKSFTVTGLSATTSYVLYVRNNGCTDWNAAKSVTFTTKDPCSLYPSTLNIAPGLSNGRTKIVTDISWAAQEANSWNYKIAQSTSDLGNALYTNKLPANSLISISYDKLNLNSLYYLAIQPVCSDKTGDWKTFTIDNTVLGVPNDHCKDATPITQIPFSTSERLGYALLDNPSSCSNFYQAYDLGDRFYKFKASTDGSVTAVVSSSYLPIVAVGYFTGNCSKPITSCNIVGSALGSSGYIRLPDIPIQKDSTYYIVAYANEANYYNTPDAKVLNIQITGEAGVAGIQDQTIAKGSVAVSPNPFTQQFQVDLSTISNPIKIQLMDAIGNVVVEQVVQKGVTLPSVFCPELKAGMYVVKVTTENGLFVNKILKDN